MTISNAATMYGVAKINHAINHYFDINDALQSLDCFDAAKPSCSSGRFIGTSVVSGSYLIATLCSGHTVSADHEASNDGNDGSY